jgi:hypothetical protein
VAFPKIVYTPTGGAETTLTFGAPARFVAAYSRVAVRHDNLSGAGVRETVVERYDDFLELTVEFIRASEVAAWQSFLDHALSGAAFAYYPDASQSSFTNYLLEDQDARLEWKSLGMYTTKLKFRKLIE